jgi:putative ABC transport system ATP-binding protein
MSEVLLSAERLYRFFHAGDEETLALRGVSLEVRAGEIVAVTGPSGSGKSTLVSCLAGLDEPDGGEVRVAGARLTRRSEVERSAVRARSIGILYQQHNLLDHLTVRQNVRLAQVLAGGVNPTWAEELLSRLKIEARGGHLPRALSGGETARAGLAVSLANKPRILLADEPTGELDAETARDVTGLLRTHADMGGCVVLVTHDPEVAAEADREIALSHGEVAA